MTPTHIVSIYDEELKYLTRRISEMGGTAEQMVGDSVRALVNTNVALAQKVISEDVILDTAERQINEKAIVTIAKRQPMAADLREIMGAIRIAAELERVGDLGKNTAKRVVSVQGSGIPRNLARGLERDGHDRRRRIEVEQRTARGRSVAPGREPRERVRVHADLRLVASARSRAARRPARLVVADHPGAVRRAVHEVDLPAQQHARLLQEERHLAQERARDPRRRP